MALLEVRDLSKSFGGVRAVDDCSFMVEPGSISALIGPNGAGKTTAFNIISALMRPDAGSVVFDGTELVGLRPHQVTRMGMGRTFQITRELGDLTVLENMMVPSVTGGLMSLFGSRILQKERERAMELLDFVGIAGLAATQAKKLSYGQKKLLEFASVFMAEPRLVLLDEPAGGVNPRLLDEIIERIRTLNRDGTTFLIVEHNMSLVMRLSHSVVVMAHGEVILQGSSEAVQGDDRVLDAYLGRV